MTSSPPISREVASGSAWASRFRRALGRWYRRSGRRDLPWRADPEAYAVLVSEFMLQQTQVATVLDYFRRWMARFPDVASLAAADEREVLAVWQGLGYYARARNLHAAAKAIVGRREGAVPRTEEELWELPGVGPYTAAAVMAFAFDRPTVVLDANIDRVIARLHDFRGRIDETAGKARLRELAGSLLPKRGGRAYTSALMDLGATVCVAGKPRCEKCPVRLFCRAGKPEQLPRKGPKRGREEAVEEVVYFARRGRLWLEQREGRRWKGLWCLPLAPKPREGAVLLEARYGIMHYRVLLRVRMAERVPEGATSFGLGRFEEVPMPAPHRRAVQRLARRASDHARHGVGLRA